ncbi:hypothetical protein [Bradyrhizobium iriomotense]|uniref:hypothetical protein n=1 Tax=Bradyrhizobium iriomotense TaxID=441950 RepID=UPI001B8A194D|nr:hypothetical protein [Bradyrhizobium iriomotense]MBR0781093.1 hypothetical protein [Bradyrhizobium iriomotense]
MGRGVRLLMKVPAVRRVMLRLWNLEDGLAKQQAALNALESHRGQLSAEQSNQQERLAQLSDLVQIQRTQIEWLIQNQQAEINELMAQQAQPAVREAAQSMQSQINGLIAQIDRLVADGDRYSAGLAEVSQHLPPAHRMNLEAALHGQQLQLGALNSTITAQQMQLAALNDIVRQMTAAPASAPAAVVKAAEVNRSEQPARRAVQPYTFEQLLNREVESLGLDLVFNIHIPKAAGNTVNALFRQLGFVPVPLDMNTNDFFATIREDRWFEGYAAPPPRDAYLMTGHMRLDQPMFRRLWMPHMIVSVLRDPVERMLSNYNFTLRRPANPWHDEVVNKGMSFVEYSSRMLDAIGPQYSFFDETGKGVFARTGNATVEDCLANLLTKVSFYGLSERFDEFAALTGYLLGRAKILAIAPANVTSEIKDLTGLPLKTELTAEERDGLGTVMKDDIWFYQEAVKEYERRMADHRLQAVLSSVLPLIKSSREAMSEILTLRDPAEPGRRAFRRQNDD